MYYVYIIQSIEHPKHFYIGYTQNLKKRIANHNAGTSFHTDSYKPWELIAFMGFKNKETALEFEKYLKSHSGRTFAKKRFW